MDIGNQLRKRLGPLTLSGWLSLFLVALVGGVILSYVQPSKTNRTYLKELIESDTIEKTAIEFVAVVRKTDNARTANETEWKQIEKGLSECMVREANKYVASNDPYLEAKADKTTPHILAKRFLRACGATD
ncbi:MAG: hypothetical protein HZC10_10780 [Nitrospirae bacterium]|nr:hypothetical protein [Nitrospirota bacterium]